jgi:hypothetical protein
VFTHPLPSIAREDTQTNPQVLPRYYTDRIENDASNNFIVACIFVTAGTCLPSRCLATIGGDTDGRDL